MAQTIIGYQTLSYNPSHFFPITYSLISILLFKGLPLFGIFIFMVQKYPYRITSHSNQLQKFKFANITLRPSLGGEHGME